MFQSAEAGYIYKIKCEIGLFLIIVINSENSNNNKRNRKDQHDVSGKVKNYKLHNYPKCGNCWEIRYFLHFSLKVLTDILDS